VPTLRKENTGSRADYVCDYITKSCTTQAEVIRNHVDPNVRGPGQGETGHRKYKRFKFGGGRAYDRSAD
jgi:hypothetical protein